MTAAVAASAKQPAGGGIATSTGKEQEREARIKERQALREVTPKNQPKPHTAQVQPSQQLQTTQLALRSLRWSIQTSTQPEGAAHS